MEVMSIKENSYAEDTCVALGNFDGIHLGHQILLQTMIEKARTMKVKSAVLLFTNHTKSLLNHRTQEILTSRMQKLSILNELGVDVVLEIPFDEDLMKLQPESFVDDVLVKKSKAQGVVVGFDYRFGYKASGNEADLRRLCAERNMECEVISPIFVNQEMISSTLIRQAIRDGDVQKARRYLGRPYTIIGKVVEGKHYGTTRGVPTANIVPEGPYVYPKNGVYQSRLSFNRSRYLAATSVGYNLTFGEDSIKIESHAIDYAGDLYGKEVALEFNHYMRPEIAFKTKDELYEQIAKDIDFIRNTEI